MTRRIEGTLELDNGTLVRFSLSRDGYQQWGQPQEVLYTTVDVLTALSEAAEEWLNEPSTRHHTDCDHYQSWLASQAPTYLQADDGQWYGIETDPEIVHCNLSCATDDDGSDDYHETED